MRERFIASYAFLKRRALRWEFLFTVDIGWGFNFLFMIGSPAGMASCDLYDAYAVLLGV